MLHEQLAAVRGDGVCGVELQLCACVRVRAARAHACVRVHVRRRGRGHAGSWDRIYLEHVVAAQLAARPAVVAPHQRLETSACVENTLKTPKETAGGEGCTWLDDGKVQKEQAG